MLLLLLPCQSGGVKDQFFFRGLGGGEKKLPAGRPSGQCCCCGGNYYCILWCGFLSKTTYGRLRGRQRAGRSCRRWWSRSSGLGGGGGLLLLRRGGLLRLGRSGLLRLGRGGLLRGGSLRRSRAAGTTVSSAATAACVKKVNSHRRRMKGRRRARAADLLRGAGGLLHSLGSLGRRAALGGCRVGGKGGDGRQRTPPGGSSNNSRPAEMQWRGRRLQQCRPTEAIAARSNGQGCGEEETDRWPP